MFGAMLRGSWVGYQVYRRVGNAALGGGVEEWRGASSKGSDGEGWRVGLTKLRVEVGEFGAMGGQGYGGVGFSSSLNSFRGQG